MKLKLKSILNQIESKSTMNHTFFSFFKYSKEKQNEIPPWPTVAIDQHALRKYAMAARTRNAI